MGKVKRVQPTAGEGPQGPPGQNTVPVPAVSERQNVPPGHKQPSQEVARPEAGTPQPPVSEGQKTPPGQQKKQEEVQPPAATPQPESGQRTEPQQNKGKGKQQKSQKEDKDQKNK
jgi:hypothetical protein